MQVTHLLHLSHIKGSRHFHEKTANNHSNSSIQHTHTQDIERYNPGELIYKLKHGLCCKKSMAEVPFKPAEMVWHGTCVADRGQPLCVSITATFISTFTHNIQTVLGHWTYTQHLLHKLSRCRPNSVINSRHGSIPLIKPTHRVVNNIHD